MLFEFFTNSSSNNTINKTLELVGSADVILRGNIDPYDFSIKLVNLPFDIETANYAKSMGNCYFISNIESLGNVATVYLEVDLLETYSDVILSANAKVLKPIERGDYGSTMLDFTGREIITNHESNVTLDSVDNSILTVLRWG